MQRLLPVGGALLRIQPHVVRELLDVDEGSEGILDQRDLIRFARLREEQQAAERLELVANSMTG